MVDGVCQHCEKIMVGCANCTSVDVCIECIDDEATIVADKCTCSKGFNADGTCKHSDSECDDGEVSNNGGCQKCSELIDGCELC